MMGLLCAKPCSAPDVDYLICSSQLCELLGLLRWIYRENSRQ